MTDTPEQKKRRPQTKKKKLEEKLNAKACDSDGDGPDD